MRFFAILNGMSTGSSPQGYGGGLQSEECCWILARVPPHPGPLPPGEEGPGAVAGREQPAAFRQRLNPSLPLPAGEGRGEGERRLNPSDSGTLGRGAIALRTEIGTHSTQNSEEPVACSCSVFAVASGMGTCFSLQGY